MNHPGPSDAELRQIEAEWPVEAAYLAVVEAECRFLMQPDVLSCQALRRAEVALARLLTTFESTDRSEGGDAA